MRVDPHTHILLFFGFFCVDTVKTVGGLLKHRVQIGQGFLQTLQIAAKVFGQAPDILTHLLVAACGLFDQVAQLLADSGGALRGGAFQRLGAAVGFQLQRAVSISSASSSSREP